jgi:hypothetical protein
LLRYRDYLRYDEYLAAGLPIATGVKGRICGLSNSELVSF